MAGTRYSGKGGMEIRSYAERTIEVEHSHIHEGISFHADTANEALANNGTILLELVVPSGTTDTPIHLKDIDVLVVGVPFKVELIESPTITTGSATITPRNRNRQLTQASYPSILTIKTNPTGISAGTTLETFYVGGGTGNAGTKSGGNAKKSSEWMLKKGLTYLIRVTNLSGATNLCSISLDWSEY